MKHQLHVSYSLESWTQIPRVRALKPTEWSAFYRLILQIKQILKKRVAINVDSSSLGAP